MRYPWVFLSFSDNQSSAHTVVISTVACSCAEREHVRSGTFVASLPSSWQRDAIARISSDLASVQNELVELCQETIQLTLSKPVFQALLEVLHRRNKRVRDVSAFFGE